MNTFELTKIVGAVCGSLLVFLLIETAAHALYNTESETVAFSVELPEGAEGEAPAEEEAVDITPLLAEADPAEGEAVFKRCASCHKVDGSDGVGPHLDGVVGRDIASVEGFNFSGALTGLEGAWEPQAISEFIEDPKDYAPGTAMSFAGLDDPEDRADLIAYLQSLGG
jgi:cytochrome c